MYFELNSNLDTLESIRWAKSPCSPVRSVLNLYLYWVASGKWFKKSNTYALCIS